MRSGSGSLALLLAVLLLGRSGAAQAAKSEALPIVRPVEGSSQLKLDEEGLAALERAPGPVAPVVVIGPYRSGKSFLLNQLMGVKCDEGFGVGHTRATQTKGVWMWSDPKPVTVNGRKVQLLYFDTEGFESTGKAEVYDDRIFALSALLSSVLVYNLPEAIRESDLEKLSFAVELSAAFFDGEEDGTDKKQGPTEKLPIRPGQMVWLIQRDFLQGKSLDAMLKEALQPVPNPGNDPGIAQLNRIRSSLGQLSRNSTALGLPQPHLDRTKLCELGDEALAPAYLTKREELRQLISKVALPKAVQGKELDGKGLAALVRKAVGALNSRDIPTAGSLVEFFNKELVSSCREEFVAKLERLRLPMNESDLNQAAAAAQKAALARFQRQKFGTATEGLRQVLASAVEKELASRKAANLYESSRVCETAELACEEVLEREGRQRLPSKGRFQAQYDKCRAQFAKACVGPALASNQERLARAWRREESRFSSEYNNRLFNGLVILSLVVIVVFRFAVRQRALESLGWAAFIFLQVYPKTFLGDGSMYEQGWWGWLVWGWEAAVYNPLMDLEGRGLPLAGFALVAYLCRRWYLPRLRGWWAARAPPRLRLRPWGRQRDYHHAKAQLDRDLDV